MRPLSPFPLVLGLSLLLSGCSLPGVVAHGVKALQEGGTAEGAAAAQEPSAQVTAPAGQPPLPQPAPPVAVQRDAVETLQ